jgi:hypothetical protein
MSSQNNWHKGHCFTTRTYRKRYSGKRHWEAYWVDGALTRTIATSEISLKDVRQKARLFLDAIKKATE